MATGKFLRDTTFEPDRVEYEVLYNGDRKYKILLSQLPVEWTDENGVHVAFGSAYIEVDISHEVVQTMPHGLFRSTGGYNVSLTGDDWEIDEPQA